MRDDNVWWWIVAVALCGAGCGDDGRGGMSGTDAGPAPSDGGGTDAGPDGGGSTDAGAPDGGPEECTLGRLLVTTSDFASGGLGVLDLATDGAESDDTDDQDTVPATLGCGAALLERSAGNLRVQSGDDPLATEHTIDLDPEGTTTPWATNPTAVVSIDETKAYVTVSMRNEVVVVDPSAGEITGSIDLSGFLDADDTDGSVDAAGAIRVDDRVYVALANYWFDEGYAIHFEGSVLAVVDAATDALVDMDDSIEGVQGIPLAGNNPWRGLWADEAGERLWVGSGGDSFAIDGMIEEVDLTTGESAGVVVEESTVGAEINGFAVVGASRLLVLAGADVIAFDPGADFPAEPEVIASGIDGMLLTAGALFTWARMGDQAGLRRFDPADGTETTPGAGPWTFGALPIYGVAAAP